MFSIQNDKNLLKGVGFSKIDINRLYLEFKNVLLEEHEEYMDYFMNEEESKIEIFLDK